MVQSPTSPLNVKILHFFHLADRLLLFHKQKHLRKMFLYKKNEFCAPHVYLSHVKIIKMDPVCCLYASLRFKSHIFSSAASLSRLISNNRNRCFPTQHININASSYKLCWILLFRLLFPTKLIRGQEHIKNSFLSNKHVEMQKTKSEVLVFLSFFYVLFVLKRF